MSCDKCACTCPLQPGDRIQHKKVIHGIRIGGTEPKIVTYASDEWVGYGVYSPKGRYLGEQMISREEFDREMEKY